MISTNDFKNGLNISWEGEPYTIIWFQHHKPGKGGAIMRVKLKNIHTGAIIERSFKSGERFQELSIEKQKMQYMYADGSQYHFMDLATYEQIALDAELIGDSGKYLMENMEVYLAKLEGNVIGVDMPLSVSMKVTYTEPGIKGDTVSRTLKPATLESGIEIRVPLFIEVGDVVKVDTRSGEYIERV
ncbi:MAG: elongation factor P [Elusimicrobia bacterium]|nr:elongation factor P [Elusimicrobiota bacterium]MBD3411820.1 elongation factor P [Elusimicrobiota bacterium]